jgi:2,3-dihydroxyphenylpropionate 1,2-dioxygenase
MMLCTTSHTPLMRSAEPAPDVRLAVDTAFSTARRYVEAFDPQLVVLFAPDHYNGFFYDLMPQFCIGSAACAIGDYGTYGGPLDVDADIARDLARSALAAGVDVAISERMRVDHGFVQPLESLFGSAVARRIVPIFVNCAAEPFTSLARVRLLGEAIGRRVAELGQRVLVVGSGGLSHDAPLPRIDTAEGPVREFLLAGRAPSAGERQAREARVAAAGVAFAAGRSDLQALNSSWDEQVMSMLASGNMSPFDDWSPEFVVKSGGHSAHEIRTWIAGYAALSQAGPYTVPLSFYAPIPQWVAGFGLTIARPQS